jgi:hypothetical protein
MPTPAIKPYDHVAELLDWNQASFSDGQVPVWDVATRKFIGGARGGGGGTITGVTAGNGMSGGGGSGNVTVNWLGLPDVTPTVTANACLLVPWRLNLITNGNVNVVANLPPAGSVSKGTVIGVDPIDATALAIVTAAAGDNIAGNPTLSLGSTIATFLGGLLMTDGIHTWWPISLSPGIPFLAGGLQNNSLSGNTPLTLAADKIAGGALGISVELTATLAGPGTIVTATGPAIISEIETALTQISLGGAPFPYSLKIANASGGAFPWTLTAGASVTVGGVPSIAQNTWREFQVTVNFPTPGLVQINGTRLGGLVV